MNARLLRRVTIACCISVLMGFTNCNKSNYEGDTIVLLGTESYVVPIEDMIPDSLEVKFPNYIGGIHVGYIPPNIEGEYVISKKEFCHSNFINLSDNLDVHLRITEQHNRTAKVELYEEGDVVTDTAYVMGNGQLFTLYFREFKELTLNDYTAQVERSVVITGEKTEEGIKDLMFGNIILNAWQGDNPFIGGFIPGWYFIYKDKDGLSENCDWFDHH